MNTSPSPHPSWVGHVLKYHSNFYYVEVSGGVYECFLKGLLKKEGLEILVGDKVTLDSVNEGNKTGRIASVLERSNVLSRPKIANVDQVVIVHSFQEPDFSSHQLDRYLTHVALAGLQALICISKCDLAKHPSDLEAIRALYQTQLDVPLVFTSVHQPETLEALVVQLRGKLSVLAGLSGAGKSSLLNKLNPSLQLRVGEVSEKIARGQHTTRHVELMEVLPELYIADTPGFSNLKFNTVLPQQVEAVYPEFAAYRTQCAFPNCLHDDEPDCVVRQNPEVIIPSRYESYREILAEAKTYKELTQTQSQKEAFGYKTLHRKGQEDLKILRLKEKAREDSRRRVRQTLAAQMEEALAEEPDKPL